MTDEAKYLTKEDFQRFRDHMESQGPPPEKFWIPIPQWQIDAWIEDGLITQEDIDAAPKEIIIR